MELQQENANLRRENADLETRIVDLKLHLKADKTSDTASIEQEMKVDIGRAAKFFHIFMPQSIAVEAFKVDKPTFLHDSPKRYDEGQEKYGIAAELHHSIPEKYLSYLRNHKSLVKEVCFFECYLIRFGLIFHYSSFCAYPMGALLPWSSSEVMLVGFSTHLRATPILVYLSLINCCFPLVLNTAKTNGSVSYLASPMGDRPFLLYPQFCFLEKIPISCQGSSSIPHSSR